MCVGITDKRQDAGSKPPESALPLGAITAGKRVRWYFVHCPEGKERGFCKNMLRVVSREVLRDAFVPRKECEVREGSGWRRLIVTVYPSYFVVVTDDPIALQRALVQHTFPLYVVGRVGNGYAPVAEEAQSFFTRVMDSAHIIRLSTAAFCGRQLRITSGPLAGCEERIVHVAGDKHAARVVVCNGANGSSGFSLSLPVCVRGNESLQGCTSWSRTAAKRVNPSLPMSRRMPKGNLRWYLVECPAGQEEALCRAVCNAVTSSVLKDAFVPKAEVVKKVHGEWTKSVREMLVGHFAVATENAAALNARLQRLGLPVRLSCDKSGRYAPIDMRAWEFVESCMDESRVIRESQGEIVGDELHVWSGPLAGKESRVTRYVRHKSMAFVDMGEDESGPHSVVMPLSILARR